jgi:hypothetical protein
MSVILVKEEESFRSFHHTDSPLLGEFYFLEISVAELHPYSGAGKLAEPKLRSHIFFFSFVINKKL